MQRQNKQKWVVAGSWLLAAVVSTLAIVAWGSGLRWNFAKFSAYTLFPVLGLVAFSLMWSHYVAGGMRRALGVSKDAIKPFLRITSWIVLVLILLHPGLLIGQLFRDGLGLPPQSYIKNYIAPNMAFAATLGSLSLAIFLAFETKRFFGNKLWWKYLSYASEIAMLAIFYHGLQLGQNTRRGWFRGVWIFYGISLFITLFYIHWYDFSANSQRHRATLEQL